MHTKATNGKRAPITRLRRKYRRGRPFNLGEARLSELCRFVCYVCGRMSLPDDDYGRDLLFELLNQRRLNGVDDATLRQWAYEYLPELEDAELDALLSKIGPGRRRSARTVAHAIGLDFEVRDMLEIRTIGCRNRTREECRAIYAMLASCNKERERRLSGVGPRKFTGKARVTGKPAGRPSLGEPWVAEGVSRRTWFRRQGGTKPGAGRGTKRGTKPRQRRHRSLIVSDAVKHADGTMRIATPAVPVVAALPPDLVTNMRHIVERVAAFRRAHASHALFTLPAAALHSSAMTPRTVMRARALQMAAAAEAIERKH
jgi:hypothetical protein